jgi:DNA-directed RNA polymerase specialized sigma24 family protein
MGRLEPLARRAIELAYFGGLGVDAIGELLDVPAAQVRQALREGLLQLGTLIKDEQETRA